MITGFTLDGEEYIWTRRPNFSECNRPHFRRAGAVHCGRPRRGVHLFWHRHISGDPRLCRPVCAWEVKAFSTIVTLALKKSAPLTEFLYPV